MGGAVYGPHGCHCYDWRKDGPEKIKEKERKELIVRQQKEIAELNRIINKLLNKKL